MNEMISHEQALIKIAEQVREALPIIELPIAECVDSICAENIICDCYISPFDNSAMDGFAFKFLDLQRGKTSFEIVGSSFAGDDVGTGDDGAWEIMTGAAVPEGFDTVIKIEDISILKTDKTGRPLEIELNIDPKTVAMGNNIRMAGQDFKPGDQIIGKNEIVNAAHIAALASVGVAILRTYRQARIAVMSTGKEIIDDAEQVLKPGQIRNSNGPNLMATLSQMHVDATYAGTIADEIDDYEQCLSDNLVSSDVIISTGAVSMGRHDFIPDSLRKLGAEIIFHKCKIRPGKPILFAKFASTEQNPNGTYYFGLPGNPISANIGLRFFVQALLNSLQNLPLEMCKKAHLEQKIGKKHDFKMFHKAFATLKNGKLNVEILAGQESFKIKPMLNANCWAVLGENQHLVEAGQLVDIYPMMAGQWKL